MTRARKTKINWPPPEKGYRPAPRPTSVKVGFIEYAILWIPNEDWITPNGQAPDLQGVFSAHDGTIRVRMWKDMHEQMYRETLWHEILHACWWHMALSDHPVQNEIADEQEEEIVKRITHASLQVMQDNPEVMAYLSAALFGVKPRG